MKRQTRGYLEMLLEDYPKYDEYVEQRKYELAHPYIEPDDNVGGGKAQFKRNDKVDRYLITCDEDKRLNDLRSEHYAIMTRYNEASETVQIICNELYFKKPSLRKYRTIRDLANAKVIYNSGGRAYVKFDDFLSGLADDLGLRQ